ncbi:type 11 methyltransferase [Calothrix parasitica NIES-267]|uniref:Type 11 methyltransferase n=1 Tax=Calothrix parasitica NIES-267 TaxID=1973488 RepID=A0A1Z4LJK5_9CYAN|nr:type 11 methyltransferase [Calothrix parasitica NIES-267]
MEGSAYSRLKPYLASRAIVDWEIEDFPICPIPVFTKGMQANSYFFGHPKWGQEYLETSHRSEPFQERWKAVMGSWDDKIIVDIGCGPGNVYATVGGKPKLLIGVDVSRSALKMASEIGYTPILTDAHHLPFVDGFADIVVANATVHHCDDMGRILTEAARLVRPGGLLFTDQDPQRTAWNLKGVGLFLRDIRYPLYRLLRSKHFIPYDKRQARWKTEVQNQRPGDGITKDVYYKALEPLGFDIKLYPHSHDLGAEVLEGKNGRNSWRLRLSQRLSGINPDTPEAAQSIMCIARRIN